MENASNPADFASLAEAKTAFTALQGDLEAAQSLANEASAKIDALTAELADAKSALDSANAELASAKADAAAKIEALNTEVAQLKSEAKTAEQRAAEIAAASGVNPVGNTPDTPPPLTATRKEFDAMSQKARIQFFAKGGKIAA